MQGGNVPEIDFSNNSLIVINGISRYGIHHLAKQLTQISNKEYTLYVEITLNDAPVLENWTVCVLIPKVSQNAVLVLAKNQQGYLDTHHYQEQLIGAWEENSPYHDGRCDTIVFTKDNIVDLYFPLVGAQYIVSDSRLIFTKSTNSFNCAFSLQENILEIFNFVDHSVTADIKNIAFTKIEKTEAQ
jgi:hypothetical protein